MRILKFSPQVVFWEPSAVTLSVPLEGGRNPSLSLDERLLGVCMCLCGHG